MYDLLILRLRARMYNTIIISLFKAANHAVIISCNHRKSTPFPRTRGRFEILHVYFQPSSAKIKYLTSGQKF
jgi:hypothetical protein